MRYILKVKDRGLTAKSPRYIYSVEDDKGNVYATRRSDREYVACLMSKNPNYATPAWRADNYFGRLDLVNKGWNKSHFTWLMKNNWEFVVVYTKEAIEKLVYDKYEDTGIQDAIFEADKYATVVNKYCSGCDNYYPAFKDEKFCLICGGAHTKRRDPDLDIPLENKTDEDNETY